MGFIERSLTRCPLYPKADIAQSSLTPHLLAGYVSGVFLRFGVIGLYKCADFQEPRRLPNVPDTFARCSWALWKNLIYRKRQYRDTIRQGLHERLRMRGEMRCVVESTVSGPLFSVSRIALGTRCSACDCTKNRRGAGGFKLERDFERN